MASPIVNKKTLFVKFKKQVFSILDGAPCKVQFTADFDKGLYKATIKTPENTITIFGNGQYISGKWRGRVFRIKAE